MAFGFDADRLLVWLAARDPDGDPLRAGSLCRRHADAMVVPVGWTLEDRRDSAPRRFSAPAHPEVTPTATTEFVDDARTVAAVAGASPSDDPDATEAIPWMPEFDDTDDLDGVLAADTPLLARAFRGTDRPR